jgi:hypothetical protein
MFLSFTTGAGSVPADRNRNPEVEAMLSSIHSAAFILGVRGPVQTPSGGRMNSRSPVASEATQPWSLHDMPP